MSSGNVSIEEIGADEVEESVPPLDDDAEILLPDDTEILLPDDDGDFDTAGLKETKEETAAVEAAAAVEVAVAVEAAAAAPEDDLPLEPLEEAAPAVAAPPPAAAPAPKVVVAPRQRAPIENDEEEDDDDIDETYVERLIGLTEMFPQSLTSGSVNLVKGCISMTQNTYNFARAASWVVFTSATILFLPIMIETERLGIEDQQKQHKSQMLLGPGVASSGGAPSLGPPPI